MKRVNITVPDNIWALFEANREGVCVSRVCSAALEAVAIEKSGETALKTFQLKLLLMMLVEE